MSDCVYDSICLCLNVVFVHVSVCLSVAIICSEFVCYTRIKNIFKNSNLA